MAKGLAKSLGKSLSKSLAKSLAKSLDKSLAKSLTKSLAKSLGESLAKSTATGGLQGTEVDLAPQPRTRQTTSQDSDGGVGAWRKPALLTPPRGLRNGPGYAALVTSLIKPRAYEPLELASLWLRGC